MKKEENKGQEEELSLLDILLDENNDSQITLYDENDKAVMFDQVAIIPYQEKLYSILKPVEEMEGVADDEAVVFAVEENEDGDAFLKVEVNEEIAMKVFDEYYKLVDDYEKNNKK